MKVHVVQFVCSANPEVRSQGCNIEEAKLRLLDKSFTESFRVVIDPRTVALGDLRDLLDTLQDRNGGRSSIGDGDHGFRAIYLFPNQVTPEMPLDKKLESGFNLQSDTAKQQMIDGLFDINDKKDGEDISNVSLGTIQVMESKKAKYPFNQRAELFMWQV